MEKNQEQIEKLNEETIVEPKFNTECTTGLFIEKNILKICSSDFYEEIKNRGESYYSKGNVLKCLKHNSEDEFTYYAKVKGRDRIPYEVTIEYTEFGTEYSCTCPCDFPCKHAYASLIAISNHDYELISLKETIIKEELNPQEIISLIPEKELKEYILSKNIFNSKIFSPESLEEHFFKYLPKQKYQYYYNNLYNAIILEENHISLTKNYLNIINKYINIKEFYEGFKIIKSIIEAYNDSDTLKNDNNILEFLPVLEIQLRIIYRKINLVEKETINDWIQKLKNNNYYNNYYLEEIILNLK